MPLRGHFREPLDSFTSWEEFLGQWPAVIVQQLRQVLPAGYVAAPNVSPGTRGEIDVAAFESESTSWRSPTGNGRAATATWSPAASSLVVETALPDFDEYEVRVYDAKRGRRLVAAIELVSFANKDRPESRNLFVGKCAALLQKGVAVSIVDLVTIKHFNLYAELLAFNGQADATIGVDPPPIYAASCRWMRNGKVATLETWSHLLKLHAPLPILPLWLAAETFVPLELEASYEKTCHDLSIT